MSEETLLTASRRVVRFFKIDEAHGGFTTPETVHAVDTLRRQIELAAKREVNAELLTAARHMEVCFSIDEAGGGLMSVNTLKAVEGLDKQVRLEAARLILEGSSA
jgi:hypothetical protein